ncbi:hypothetical protein C0989_012494 [Termitomyces sp. Mn162]|nr:hypothetical protein C0989_012494 [Termitomyces sp. Mn162]
MASLNRPNAGAHEELYDAGMIFRKKVMTAWGTIWTRPGLELKQRSLINIALLASQGKEAELAGHIRYVNNGMMRIGALMHSFSGAVNNGASVLEIRETLLQTALYSGIPTGMASFRVAEAALAKLEKEDKI